MRFHYRILLPLLLGLCLSLSAVAQSGSDLYAGEVPVTGKSEADRLSALGMALRQVIGKLTGLASPQSAILDEAAANAQSYLQQFQYRGQEESGGLRLWARFNAQAMDDLVSRSGLPVWSRQRPPLLTWIALRGAGGVELFNLEDPGGLAQAIRQSAWQRGLPLEFPLLDLEDRAKLSADDVWALNTQKLLDASRRYSTSSLFVARIERGRDELWTARWSLLSGQDLQQWTSQGTSMEAVVAFGINSAADRIARREALTPIRVQGAPVQVRISGLRNLNDYARTLKYLQSFEQVTRLALRKMRGEELTVQLIVRGGAGALDKLISFGDVLKALTPAGGTESMLRFALEP